MNSTSSFISNENQRFGFWGNLPLGRKLLLAFGALFVLGLVIAASGLFGLNRVQGAYEDTLAGGVEIQHRSDLLSTPQREAPRREKDFLLRWKTEGFDAAYESYVKVNQQNTADMKTTLKDLEALAPVLDRNPLADYSRAQYESDITNLNQGVVTYEQAFESAVRALEERGFVDTGLEGEFRTSVQAIEAKIYDRDGLEPLVITMLQIRRREKDYLLRGDQQYVDNVHDLVTQLKDQVTASDVITPAEKVEIRALADNYRVNFDTLVQKDVDVAADIEVLRAAAADIEATTARLESAGEQLAVQDVQTAQANSTQTFTLTGVTVLFVLIASIALALVLSRQITNPVTALTSTANQVALGNFDAKAEVTTGDEIGTLASTFNSMTAQLRQTLETIQRRAAELATVAKVSTDATQATDTDTLLQQVVDQAKESFNLYHTHIYLMNNAGDTLVLASGAGEVGRQMVSEGRSISLDREQSLVARAARTRLGVTVNDVRSEPDFLPNPLLPDTRSELAVPLVVGDKVLGVFDVQSNEVSRFTAEDVNIQTTLASQVAVALQNTRQYAETQRKAVELELASRVGTAAATIIETDKLLQEVVDQTKQAFNLYHAHIYLMNEAGDILELAAGAGDIGKQMVAEGRRIPLDREQSLVARTARNRDGVIVNNVRVDPDFLPHPLLPETRSEMAVPMVVGDKVIGVFDVQSNVVDHFNNDDIRIQTTLAAQIAVALQNSRTFLQAQRQAERESMLNVIGQKIQGAATVEAVLQIAARELGRALGAPLTIAQLGMGLNDRSNGNGN